MYESAITYFQDSPDPAVPGQVKSMSVLELARNLAPGQAVAPPRALILGAPGSGKTMLLYLYRYLALQQTRALIFGRAKVPVYIPLRNYGLYLEACNAIPQQEMAIAGTKSLLDFLYTSDMAGMRHLRPFLDSLQAQGRVLLLCDGLDEVDEKHQAAVMMELAGLMGQNQNQLVLTCREGEYWEMPQLAQSVAENLVARVHLNALDANQERSFVKRCITQQAPGKKSMHTAGACRQ